MCLYYVGCRYRVIDVCVYVVKLDVQSISEGEGNIIYVELMVAGVGCFQIDRDILYGGCWVLVFSKRCLKKEDI